MQARRDFFTQTFGALLGAGFDFRAGLLRDARSIVGSGALGPLTYCRALGKHAPTALRFVLQGVAPGVVSYDETGCGLTLCGTDATLAISSTECRIYPSRRAAGFEK